MYSMMEREYMYNRKFRQCVDDYCAKNSCTIHDAFKDTYIRQMFWRYTDV